MAIAASASLPMSALSSTRPGSRATKNGNIHPRQGGAVGNFGHFVQVVRKDVEFLKTRISKGIGWANEALHIPQLSKTLDDVVWLRNLEDPHAPPFQLPSWPHPYYPELSGVDLFVADLKALEAYISYFYYRSKMLTKPLPEIYDPQKVDDYFSCRPHVVGFRLLEHNFQAFISRRVGFFTISCW